MPSTSIQTPRNKSDENAKFGLRIALPANDPLAEDHLIGDQFPVEKWFETEKARDAEMQKLTSHHPFYRREDKASMVITKLEA